MGPLPYMDRDPRKEDTGRMTADWDHGITTTSLPPFSGKFSTCGVVGSGSSGRQGGESGWCKGPARLGFKKKGLASRWSFEGRHHDQPQTGRARGRLAARGPAEHQHPRGSNEARPLAKPAVWDGRWLTGSCGPGGQRKPRRQKARKAAQGSTDLQHVENHDEP